jgi:hypothetical protein
MAIEIEVDYPHYEKGLEMELEGVLVKNGSTTKLSDEQEQAFVARHGKTVKEVIGKNEFVKVGGTATITPAKLEKEGGES